MTLYYPKLTGVKLARLDIFWKRFAQLGVCYIRAAPRRRRETKKAPRFLGGFLLLCTNFEFERLVRALIF